MSKCLFCLPDRDIIGSNFDAIAIRDGFPVSPMHTLIIPKRHVIDYFDLNGYEMIACDKLICRVREDILKEDSTVTGFNIGINCGVSAGQTIMHCHIHLIPRRDGDVEDPRGGVRHVIPEKANYESISIS